MAALTLLTGGWTCLDESQRATSEASKIALNMASPPSSPSPPLPPSTPVLLSNLESLAMGGDATRTSLAVRELLKKTSLPVTSAGAQLALEQMDRWSPSSLAQSFSPAALQAASSVASRTKSLLGRSDFRSLKTFAIDAPRTSFRDDAISVRSQDELLIHIADASAAFRDAEVSERSAFLIGAADPRFLSGEMS